MMHSILDTIVYLWSESGQELLVKLVFAQCVLVFADVATNGHVVGIDALDVGNLLRLALHLSLGAV